VELSIDKDWWRPKGTVIWASGDEDPDDDEARGIPACCSSTGVWMRS
jgi:hypothetical protein